MLEQTVVPTRNLMVQFMVRYFHRYQNENPRTIRSLENNLNVESIIFSSVFFQPAMYAESMYKFTYLCECDSVR